MRKTYSRPETAPEYVRRRKTPLTYLFSGRPARLAASKLSLEGHRVPAKVNPTLQGRLGIAAQLVGENALRAGLEEMPQLR
jgi:hypothetical protein